jgi:hypothetical protein
MLSQFPTFVLWNDAALRAADEEKKCTHFKILNSENAPI